MAFWRYLRDVMIVVVVLLFMSGLVVSWWILCLIVYLAALIASVVWDCKWVVKPVTPKKRVE